METTLALMDETQVDAFPLDLGIEELDEMIAPGFWETAAGVVTGTAVGAGAIYVGYAVVAT